MKRFFAILLTVTIIFSAFPVIPVFAESKPETVAHVYMHYDPEYHDDEEIDCDEELLSLVSASLQNVYDQNGWVRLRSIDITLCADCTTKYFPRCRDWDLNINLNGHTWTTSENRPSFEVANHKSISISNGTLTFTGTPDYPIYTYGGAVNISNVVFKDCVCDNYGLIAVESKGSVEAYPTAVDASKGEIYQKYDEKASKANGGLHLKNVRFENCKSSSYGACVYVDSNQTDPMTFDNCQFINCSSQYGGALYFNSDYNTYNFTNCEFTNCSATTDGGAIYCESEDSKLGFTNCSAYRCHADDCGGFMFFSGENTVINGAGNLESSTFDQRSNIIGCYALGSGGAFYSSVEASSSNYSQVRNFNMAYNTAGASTHSFDAVKARNSNSWGGAVCLRGTDMKLAYCDLYSNYANWYGGAVYCGYRRTSVENCTFYENRCSDGYGNDIYLDSATQYVTGCTFYTSGNSVAGYDAATWSNNVVTPVDNLNQKLFSGAEIEEGDYIINCAVDEKYSVAISGGKDSVDKEGANVHLWEDGAAEVFTVTKDKSSGSYIIKSKLTGLVLDVAGASRENGANIQQSKYNGTDAQHWVFEDAGNGYYYIRCVGGQYMDVDSIVNGKKPYNDVNIQSWSFTGASNQQFKLVKANEIEEGDYIFHLAYNEKYTMNISRGRSVAHFREAEFIILNYADENVFTITKDPVKDAYIIKPKGSDLVLQVPEGYSKYNFASINQAEYNGTDRQRWAFESAGKGYYAIRCLDGMYMGIWGTLPENGYPICSVIHNLNAANIDNGDQKFRLEKVSGDTKTGIDAEFTSADGSKEKPYKIYNADQWRAFALSVALGETYSGKYIELNSDIAISYIPVGNFNAQKGFKGTLDGKNHTINYLDYSENWDRGLFSFCNGATIKNLRVTGKIYGTESLAGICAGAISTTFENCTNDADITSNNASYAAGISAKTSACKFINCVNNGKIQCGKDFAGGIAAQTMDKSEFTGCRNNGEISANGMDVGGILGIAQNSVTVKKCVNSAPVTAGNVTAAGIVGSCQQDANIISCINNENGVISAKQYAAGMLAWAASSSHDINIKNCANSGEIKATVGDCGGIAVNHKDDKMTVVNCFNATTKIPKLDETHTTGIAEGDYIICTALNEKYAVDIENGNNAKNISGKNAHLWENGDANVFTITKDNTKGTYIIKSKVTGLVLDVSGASKDDGANIQQWESNGTDAQRWVFEPAGNGCCYIRCVGGQYMDASGMVNGAKPSNGVNIQSWSFTGAANQQFKLVRVNDIADGDYIIYTALNEKLALDIEGGKTSVNVWGRNVFLWENGEANVFTITKDKNAYSIRSKVTGLMLDVYYGIKDNGTNIQQWEDNGLDPQRWVFEPAGNGYYYIRCVGGQYMDVSGFNAVSGGNIHSWQFTGADNQKFRLVNLPGSETVARNGAIASGSSKGTFTNCYYIAGGIGDKRGNVLSLADCGETLKTSMNTYIAKNIKGKEAEDWAMWQTNSKTGISLPDIESTNKVYISGEGTAAKPYTISNAKAFKEFVQNVELGIDYKDKYIRLTDSIAYTGKPIGSQGNPFRGIFDGDGHSVTLYMSGGVSTSLFSELDGATVKNLRVSGAIVGSSSVGGIAGYAYGNSRIDNCLVTASVEGSDGNIGGIAGALDNSTISNCRMEGSVTNTGWTSTGGIVGGILSNCKLVNCVNKGVITADKAVGGLVGCIMYGDSMIVNCASGGSTDENSDGGGYEHGGLVGFINGEINTLTVSNCFTSCAVNVTKDSGFAFGNNQNADKKVSVDHIYYKKAGNVSIALGTGNELNENSKSPFTLFRTISDAKATELTTNTETDTTPKTKKEIDGITLTSWSKETSFLAPQSYVEVSSLVASVFSAENLPALIVIGAGLIAGIVFVTVMYRKKKKKN